MYTYKPVRRLFATFNEEVYPAHICAGIHSPSWGLTDAWLMHVCAGGRAAVEGSLRVRRSLEDLPRNRQHSGDGAAAAERR